MNLDRIKSRAKDKGWKMSYICDRLEISHSYFTDVKNGKTSISEERLIKIAEILDTTPEYLTNKSDIKEKLPGRLMPTEENKYEKLFNKILDLSPEQLSRVMGYIDFLHEENRRNH